MAASDAEVTCYVCNHPVAASDQDVCWNCGREDVCRYCCFPVRGADRERSCFSCSVTLCSECGWHEAPKTGIIYKPNEQALRTINRGYKTDYRCPRCISQLIFADEMLSRHPFPRRYSVANPPQAAHARAPNSQNVCDNTADLSKWDVWFQDVDLRP